MDDNDDYQPDVDPDDDGQERMEAPLANDGNGAPLANDDNGPVGPIVTTVNPTMCPLPGW